jgi:N-acetylmuramoyl-L-alanine amidase
MINPEEFEWITNYNSQQKLVVTIADGIIAWLNSKTNSQ